MSYYEFSQPLSLYRSPFSKKDTLKDDADVLIKQIVNFAQNTKLWASIGSSFPHWAVSGLNDIEIPRIRFKNLDFNGDLVHSKPITIELNKKNIEGDVSKNIEKYYIPKFAQVLIQELSNFKNIPELEMIYENVTNLKRDEFIMKVEKLEFSIRLEISKAYLNKDFNSNLYPLQTCIFDTNVTDFNDYYNDKRLNLHKEQIGEHWDYYNP